MDYDYGEYVLDENVEIEDEEYEQYQYYEQVAPKPQVQQTRLVMSSSQQQQQQQQQEILKQQQIKSYYENKAAADEKKIFELQTNCQEVTKRLNEAKQEIMQLKSRKSEDTGAREKIKQLEERVTLIKTKAKEKIEEKDGIITELNTKMKNYEEMLAMLENTAKEAVVKFNDFQQEIARKEEIIQQHNAFKNRFEYTVNYLTEKCQFLTESYEKKIRALESKLGKQPSGSDTNKPIQIETKPIIPAPAVNMAASQKREDSKEDLLQTALKEIEDPSPEEKDKITLTEAIEQLETVENMVEWVNW